MTIPLEIREVLVCDDIRREDNGKAILIGVYSGDMLFSAFPANMRLSFWLQGRARKGVGAGTAQFRIQVTEQDTEQTPVFVEAEFDAPPHDEMIGGVLVFVGVPLAAKQPGHLVMSVKEDSGDWVELMRKRIAPAKSTQSANDSLPLS